MARKKWIPFISAITVCSALLSSQLALSADSQDQIKHRQAIMEGIGGHLSAIFSTLKTPDSFGENYLFHAESLSHLAKISVDTFPPESAKGKTKASEDIWSKPEEFKQAMDLMLERADGLVAAVNSGDTMALVDAAKKLGGSCKGCHDDFKQK